MGIRSLFHGRWSIASLGISLALTLGAPSPVQAQEQRGDDVFRISEFFAISTPDASWKWDESVYRRSRQVLFVKKGKGDARLPQLSCHEAQADSDLTTPEGFVRDLEQRLRTPPADGTRLEGLEVAVNADTVASGRSAHFVQRARIVEAKSGKLLYVWMEQGFARGHPWRPRLVGTCSLVWITREGVDPLPATPRDLETVASVAPLMLH